MERTKDLRTMTDFICSNGRESVKWQEACRCDGFEKDNEHEPMSVHVMDEFRMVVSLIGDARGVTALCHYGACVCCGVFTSECWMGLDRMSADVALLYSTPSDTVCCN